MPRALLRRVFAIVAALLTLSLSISAPAPLAAASAPARASVPALAGALPAATSPDGRISVTASASPGTITKPGSLVTWTYTVRNLTSRPARQVSMTDTECGPITAVSGVTTDGFVSTIPAGGTATYTCTGPVDATQTGTVTASFDIVAADGTRSRSTATATSTVTMNPVCSTIYYGGFPATSTVGGLNTGAIGTVDASGLTATLPAPRLAPNAGSKDYEYFRGIGVDPNTGAIYYVPSKLFTRNEVGLYRINPDGSGGVRVVASSAATDTERLAVAPDGTVWSWAVDYRLYSLAPGATTWVDHGAPPGPWPASIHAGAGDIAFDGDGNLWLLGNNAGGYAYLVSVPQSGLTGTITAATPATSVSVSPSTARYYNGLAFGADGRLYASMDPANGNNIVDVIDPVTGVGTQFVQEGVWDDSRLADLGSCAMPQGDLVVSKSAQTQNAAVRDGDTITYTITVRNVGSVPVFLASLVDAVPTGTTYQPGSTTLNGSRVPDTGGMPFRVASPIKSTTAVNDGVIAAGATATVSFKVTVNGGTVANRALTEISNQATVTSSVGTLKSDDPATATGTTTSPDPTRTFIDRTAVALTKTASVPSVVGDGTVTYTYTVTNPGTDALADVAVTDVATTTARGNAAPLSPSTCASPTRTDGDTDGDGLLDPNETWIYSCRQPLAWTSGDADPTTVANTATVAARGSITLRAVTATAQASVKVVPRPFAPSVTKTPGAVSGPDATTGEYTATYTVAVTNTGQLPGTYGPLTDTPAFDPTLRVLGARWSGQSSGSATGAGPFTLAPAGTTLPAGATHTYTVTVRFAPTTTTAATACDGPDTGLFNHAALPDGQEIGTTDDNAACLAPPAPPKVSLTLTKTAGSPVDANGNGVIDAGDTLAYTFTVSNTSPLLALSGVTVADSTLTAPGVTISCPTSIAPNTSATCTASKPYVLTQADVDSGAAVNTAWAWATAPHLTDRVKSPESKTSVTLLRAPTLGLSKRATAVTDVNSDGVTDPGDTIGYEFIVTNRGNVTLTGVAVTDPMLTKAGITVDCPTTTLAPGDNARCTTSRPYLITRTDQEAGSVANTATATASSQAGPAPAAKASAQTPVAPIGRLVVRKSAGSVSSIDPTTGRATVGYTVTVSNVGGSPISYGALTDTPGFANGLVIDSATWTGPTDGSATSAGPYTLSNGGYLGAGASHTYAVRVTFHHTGTAPVAACSATPTPGTGLFNRVDLAKGDPADPAVDLGNAATCAAPPAPPTTGLTVTKTVLSNVDVDKNNRTSVGDRLTYRFAVKNTGSTVVTGLVVNDEKLAAASPAVTITCTATTLAPGGETTCTSTEYTVTTADEAAGAVNNSATVTATPPNLAPVTSASSGISTPVTRAGLDLTKSAGAITDVDGNGPDAGDTIAYTFTAKNTGTTDLTNVTVTDPRLGAGAVCTIASLLAGKEASCEARTYTLTQADVDAGVVKNDARVTGVAADGGVAPVATASTTTTITPRPATLTLVKTAGAVTDANTSGKQDAGDTLTYTFTVTNTSTQTLSAVKITDETLGLTGENALACGTGSLAPGASTSCEATYTLTTDDFTATKVDNTATASATAPRRSDPVTDTASISTPLNAETRLVVDATAPTPPAGVKAGDTLTYTVTVTNDGNTRLTGLEVSSPGLTLACDPATDTLEPGRSTTCTATVTLTQTDIDAGSITRAVTATTTDPATTTSDTVTTPLAGTSKVTLDKEIVKVGANGDKSVTDTDGNGTDLGDVIRYRFTVTNAGTTTLEPVTITDPRLHVDGRVCASSLAPGASVTCEFDSYRLEQQDVDDNSITNTATANGTTKLGAAATPGTDTETAVYDPVVEPAAFVLSKSANGVDDSNGSGRQDAGDTVAYTFAVTNTGPLTIHDLQISDPMLGAAFDCGKDSIGPGATATCVSPTPYRLTQVDIDRGFLENTATVHGLDPKKRAVAPARDSETLTLAPSSSIELTKTASAITDVDGNGPDAGDTVTYRFTARNTGALTLAPVTITDTKLGLTNAPCVDTLAPGASAPCATSTTYTLTQADVDTRRLENTATVTGLDPAKKPVQGDASAGVDITNVGRIALAKNAGTVTDLDGNGPDVGDTIAYSFQVSNIGNVTLSKVELTDDKLEGVACEAATLAPGATTKCSADPYVLTQADVDAGRVDNSAAVSARAPGGAVAVADDTATVTFQARSGVELTKAMTNRADTNGNGATDTGDVLTYTITVRNSGAVTVQKHVVTDPLLPQLSCETGPIAPDATRTCTGTYTVTEADQRAGRRDNTARVDAVTAGNRSLSATGATSTRIATPANLDVSKTAGTVSAFDPVTGQATATYTVRVTNTGGTPKSYTLTDTPAFSGIVVDGVTWTGPVGGSAGTAGPWTLGTATVGGEATHEYVVTVRFHATSTAAIPADGLKNAVALGTGEESGPTTNNTATPAPPSAPVATVELRKSVASTTDPDGNGRLSAGDVMTYALVVRNTGTVQLTGIAVTDTMLGEVTCPATTLPPDASTTCTAAAHKVTDGEVAAKAVTNTASVIATPPATVGGKDSVTDSATATIPITDAALALTKTHGTVVDANGSGRVDKGDTVAYTFAVRNTGTTNLRAVTVSDPKIGVTNLSCIPETLAPSATPTTCRLQPEPYVLTQADIDAGRVVNDATATGTPSDGGSAPIAKVSDTLTLDGVTSALTLKKTSGGIVDLDGNGADEGDRITYTFTLTNSGVTTLFAPTVSDVKVSPSQFSCGDAELAPEATTSCTVDHTVTQTEIDANGVTNTATASARSASPTGPTVASPESSVTTPITAVAALTLDKTAGEVVDANRNGRTDAGDTLAYTFSVQNTGATTLTGVAVADPRLTTSEATGLTACAASSLAPRGTKACTATHTLTQAEVDAGSVTNTATVTADGTPRPTASDATTTTLTPTSSMTVTGTPGTPVTGSDGLTAGDTAPTTFTVTNTGSTTLTDVRVNGVVCTPASIAPGGNVTCTPPATVLTQADIDRGFATQDVTVTATPATGSPLSQPSSVTIPLTTPTPSVALTKQAGSVSDTNGNGRADVGETIGYTFTVRNSGAVTLTTVMVSDAKVAAEPFSCATDLAPGATATCPGPASYVLTQADIEQGNVVNSATAVGTTPAGVRSATATATDTRALSVANSLTLTKASDGPLDTNGNRRPDAGETVPYRFTVTNAGQQTLTGVTITDDTLGLKNVPCAETLAPGKAVTCTTGVTPGMDSRTLTQADVDAGRVTNTATAHASAPNGQEPEASSAVTVDLEKVATLEVTSSAPPLAGTPKAGDTVTVTVTVTNTGNTTVSGVTGTTTLPDGRTVTCTPNDRDLAPGEHGTCTITYTLTQADIDAGRADLTTTITGTDSSGGATTATTGTKVEFASTSSMTLTKSRGTVTDTNGDGAQSVGDAIAYTFTVHNSGTTNLLGVSIDDPALGITGFSCGTGTLAPGKDATCGPVSTTLTQTALDAGVLRNTATAHATGPASTSKPVEAVGISDTPLTPTARFTLVKSASSIADTNGSGRADEGDEITYTFTVKNTGSQGLTDVRVTDGKLGVRDLLCAATLAPGADATCFAPAYRLTLPDVDAGSVRNTASATARPVTPDSAAPITADPDGSSPSTTTPITAVAALTLEKRAEAVVEAAAPAGHSKDDTVAYSFTVTNTSSVTLTDITITDPRVALVTCKDTTLAPKGTTECSSSPHTITQAEVDARRVENTATVSGTTPAGASVTSTAFSRVDLAPTATIALAKAVTCETGADGRCDRGDILSYSFTVTNTGAASVDRVEIDDPALGLVDFACGGEPLGTQARRTCPSPRSHTVTQADLDAGLVKNDAMATAFSGTEKATGAASVTQTFPTTPTGVSLTKTLRTLVDTDGSRSWTEGDTVSWTFTVTNTGQRTLRRVTVDDLPLGVRGLECVKDLAPGEKTTCESPTHTITAAEVAAGAVTNTATATGELPTTGTTTGSGTSTVPLTDFPTLALTKKADLTDTNGDGMAGVGDSLRYTFTVANTGTETVHDPIVDDPMLSAQGIAVDCPTGDLTPGADPVTCTARTPYVLTDADVAHPTLDNEATAQAVTAQGNLTPLARAALSTPVGVGRLAMTKTVELTTDGMTQGVADEGDVVVYRFAVTNTGTLPVSDVGIDDAALAGVSVTCKATTLDPGQGTECASAPVTVTAAAIAGGVLTNTASAHGTAGGRPVSSPASTGTASAGDVARPALELHKYARREATRVNTALVAGEKVTYFFVVVNTGNVEVKDLAVADELLGADAVTCDEVTLAPGEHTDCTAPVYTVTPEDVARTYVQNDATVTGKPAQGGAVQATGADAVRIPAEDTGLDVVKTASITKDDGFPGQVDPGDEVTYTFLVTNTSSAPATVQVRDAMLAAARVDISCAAEELQPGTSTTCTSDPYTVPESVPQGTASGALTNTVLATSQTQGGNDSSGSATATTPIAPVAQPELDLTMGYDTADTDGNGRLDAGETVLFRYRVTNTGNVPLKNLTVVDDRVSSVTCERTTLDVGESTSCVAGSRYTVTAADVAAGRIVNRAVVNGLSAWNGLPTPPPAQDAVTIVLAGGAQAPAPGPAPTDDPTDDPTPDPTDDPTAGPTPGPTTPPAPAPGPTTKPPAPLSPRPTTTRRPAPAPTPTSPRRPSTVSGQHHGGPGRVGHVDSHDVPWLLRPHVPTGPDGRPGGTDGTTDGRGHRTYAPGDPRHRSGKGYPVGELGPRSEGYSQANDPNWQAGPGDAGRAGGAHGSGAVCMPGSGHAAGCRPFEDGSAVGRPPWVWLTLWTLLGLGIVAIRRRRDKDDRETPPAAEA